MLAVIAILGLIAGLAVPALKNLGKSDATVSAARQLLDDIGQRLQVPFRRESNQRIVPYVGNDLDHLRNHARAAGSHARGSCAVGRRWPGAGGASAPGGGGTEGAGARGA